MAVPKVAEMQLIFVTMENKFTLLHENVMVLTIAQTDLMRQAVHDHVATPLHLEEKLLD